MSGTKGTGTRRRWTEVMDAALLELVGECTVAQAAKYIGVTKSAAINRMWYFKTSGIHPGIGNRGNMSPHKIPRGCMLLAKSCTRCGKIRPAQQFFWNKTKATHSSECRLCSVKIKRDARAIRGRDKCRENYDLLQDVSRENAHHHGAEWTSSEHDQLADMSISDFDMAIALGRTMYAVTNQRSRLGLFPQKPQITNE